MKEALRRWLGINDLEQIVRTYTTSMDSDKIKQAKIDFPLRHEVIGRKTVKGFYIMGAFSGKGFVTGWAIKKNYLRIKVNQNGNEWLVFPYEINLIKREVSNGTRYRVRRDW